MRKSVTLAAIAGSMFVTSIALADAPKGARAEGLVGWDRASLDLGNYGLGTYSENGFAYGGQLGYDIPLKANFSVGIDAEIDASTARYRFGSASISVGRDLYAGGRATLAVSPDTNVYAKAGYANGRVVGNGFGYRAAENGNGVRFGLGIQQALSLNTYGVIEYRYTNYQDNFSRNQVMTGFGFRF